MTQAIKAPKKLIEVALPLDAINAESALRKRKAPGGYPTTLHKWWAQRPVAAARAVIFGQMVNDPSWKWEIDHPGEVPPNNLKASWAASRNRLFGIIEDLVKWENTTNEDVQKKAQEEIRKSWRETCELNKDHPQAAELFIPDKLPDFHDPFAGGGTLPLEAQWLGLESYASDLNPVAVLINKAMIEIPPKFAGRAPVNPEVRNRRDLIARTWKGVDGIAEDVRYYGQWMRGEAQKRIGHLYPPIEITAEMAKDRPDLNPLIGKTPTVIAWLWARTVKSPNPAFRHIDIPLASTFILSSKEGKESYVQAVVEGDHYHFIVKVGKPPKEAKEGTKAVGRGANFHCVLSDTPIDGDYIKAEGQAGRMGTKLMAIVVEGARGRVYLAPTQEQEDAAQQAQPTWKPIGNVPARLTGGTCVPYGLTEWGDLFTPRQLVALTTFSDLVGEAIAKVKADALTTDLPEDGPSLDAGGTSATAYAEAVSVYLSFAINRVADYGSSLATWRPKDNAMRSTLASQAIPMAYDFAEGSPFAKSSSGFAESTNVVAKAIEFLSPQSIGHAAQQAAQQQSLSKGRVVSTDPPYYNNIAYADLSDFLYLWLRRSLKPVFPELFATVVVPKAEELVASPHRHGGSEKAEAFFLGGMTQAMHTLAAQAHVGLPITIYYAYKQSETETDTGTSSTGWETFLEAVTRAGLAVTGTWPMRTEGDNRQVSHGANALASSIVLVCRPRSATADTISRRAFLRELNHVLPEAFDEMTRGSGDGHSPVAPVDLSQAIIGPGMAVFSKYAAVLEADGTPMSVRTALQLINRFLAEDDFDHDTQFCLHWFEQYGWKEGKFGDADLLARAKGTSVDGVKHAGVLFASGGVVRLLKWCDYPADWDPENDNRLPVWELLHQLIRVFKTEGETGAGKVLAAAEGKTEATRLLAYRLNTLCERAGWAEDAGAYNEIVTSWSAIEAAATAAPVEKQASLFS
jgi:putative DNA methylase